MFLCSGKAKMRFNHGAIKKKTLNWELGDLDPRSGGNFL